MHAIRQQRHLIGGLHNLQPGVPSEQLDQHVRVVGIKMLDHDERAAGVAGHVAKEPAQGLQSAGGGTYADYRQIPRGNCGRKLG